MRRMHDQAINKKRVGEEMLPTSDSGIEHSASENVVLLESKRGATDTEDEIRIFPPLLILDNVMFAVEHHDDAPFSLLMHAPSDFSY